MNITYRITKYPDLERYYWVILLDHEPVRRGDEASQQDCLDVMSDMTPSLTDGKAFSPHIGDSRWKNITMLEINSRDF